MANGSQHGRYRIVQPWGPDKGRQATTVSTHATVTEAFAALDRLTDQALRTGAGIEAIELIIVDATGRPVPRPPH
jgi:hypothetical protein